MKHYSDDKRDFAASEDIVRKITNPRSGVYIIIILFMLILAGRLFGGGSEQEQADHSEVDASDEVSGMNDDAAISSQEPIGSDEDVVSEGVADYPAMIRVKGDLYYDSGEISEELRCGMMDGQITSMAEGEPTEDDQSNFGSGYGYQYGANTIEVCIDDTWHVFLPYQTERTVDWDSLSEQEKMEIEPTYRGE